MAEAYHYVAELFREMKESGNRRYGRSRSY